MEKKWSGDSSKTVIVTIKEPPLFKKLPIWDTSPKRNYSQKY